MRRVIIRISGKVQGVFFRFNVLEIAQSLKLKGWVKNELRGTVKIAAEGEEYSLKKLIDWCYQGPERAKVKKVEVDWKEPENEFEEFKIKYF